MSLPMSKDLHALIPGLELKGTRFVDVSNRAAVVLTGSESRDLMQRISTNDLSRIKPCDLVHTVLTNEKGRIVSAVSVLMLGDERLLLLGQGDDQSGLVRWIEKFVIMEDVAVSPAAQPVRHFILYGSTLNNEFSTKPKLEEGRFSTMVQEEGETIELVYVERWYSNELLHFFSSGKSDVTSDVLTQLGSTVVADHDYDHFRIMSGIPSSGRELSQEFNPLEAGLTRHVSFAKGCYVGQEVIARLDTYKKVQREMIRVRLAQRPRMLPAQLIGKRGPEGVVTSVSSIKEHDGHPGIAFVGTTRDRSLSQLMCICDGENIPVKIPEGGSKI